MAGGVADGRHDGRGGGQHQGAGAEDHQDGHRPDDLPGDCPGDPRRDQGDDHDPGGPAVGQVHDLGLAGVGGLDQADHPLDGTVLPHLGSLHGKGPKLVYGAAGHLVPLPLVHGEGLAGHHRLVDGGLALENHPVHRDGLSGEDPELVPHLDVLRGDNLLSLGRHHPSGAGGKVDQLLNPRPGLGHGEVLQKAAQLHDEGHLAGGKIFPNEHRGHKGHGHQHIRLDVKGSDQADDGLQQDRHSAEEDGNPSRIHRQILPPKNAAQERHAAEDQEGDVLLGPAPLQKRF